MEVALLLDTSAYSRMVRGHPATVSRIKQAERVLFSVIVEGELRSGFRRGSRYDANAETLEQFLHERFVTVLDITRRTAHRYGLIMAALRRTGTPIPTNDVWLAAQAMETGAQLLSGDGHFAHVDGLDWVHLSAS